jgi:hypothetical protein
VIFAIATFLPINMGALAFVAAFVVGTLSVGLDTDVAGTPTATTGRTPTSRRR